MMSATWLSFACALARWAWKGRQYVVQVRATADGLVLQQLLYADEVRSLKDLDIEKVEVSQPELDLALQLIEQNAQDAYDPHAYHDDEKKRILAAIDAKIAGKEVVATEVDETAGSAQVIDLMAALRASLNGKPAGTARAPARAQGEAADATTSSPARGGGSRGGKGSAKTTVQAPAAGTAEANISWDEGPWGDWVPEEPMPADSPWVRFYDSLVPTVECGFVTPGSGSGS